MPLWTPYSGDPQVVDIAGLTPTDNGVIIGNGTNFVVESGTTLMTSLNVARPRFKAALAANQTGIADATSTKLQFSVETYDVGGYYDAVTNYRWTPPAGPIILHLLANMNGTYVAGNEVRVEIKKNGLIVTYGTPSRTPYIDSGLSESTYFDVANGTDYYEPFVYADTSAGTTSVNGTVAYLMDWAGFCL